MGNGISAEFRVTVEKGHVGAGLLLGNIFQQNIEHVTVGGSGYEDIGVGSGIGQFAGKEVEVVHTL